MFNIHVPFRYFGSGWGLLSTTPCYFISVSTLCLVEVSVCVCVVLYDTLTFDLVHTEVPFDNGKVVGMWYVGNIVYTVGQVVYLQ